MRDRCSRPRGAVTAVNLAQRMLAQRLLVTALLTPVLLMQTFVARADAAGFRTYEPATVDPPISRPATRSCDVVLFREHGFAGNPDFRSPYAPPSACPGPWSKVVLTVDTHVKGRQFDRVGRMTLGGAEILRFSTAEPTRHGIHYRIDKDVTAYSPLLRSAATVSTELGNVVNATYTGVFMLSARLRFYAVSPAAPAPRVADTIEPFEAAPNTNGSANGFAASFPRLPSNIVHAVLDLYVTNHGCDEFWYSNQSDAYVRLHPHHDLCGGGPYREIDIFVDGRPATIVYPFPYIWTGGVNPLLWRPLSAYHTLDVPAYAVDLDPWAGALSTRGQHVIRARVWNDSGSWFIGGSLMLWTDRHARQTSGAVTNDTIVAGLRTAATLRHNRAGDAFTWSGAKRWSITGYVDTSAGRVWHRIDDHMRFDNAQLVELRSGRGDATQHTTFTRSTWTRDGTGTHVRRETFAYPLVVNATYPPPTTGSPYGLMITARVHQAAIQRGSAERCTVTIDGTATFKRLKSHDDGVEIGQTIEKNFCRGVTKSFAIVKAANNGRLRTLPGSLP